MSSPSVTEAEHLLARGLRSFTFLTAEDNRPEFRQQAGFVETLEDKGFSVTLLDVPGTWDDSLAGLKSNARLSVIFRREVGVTASRYRTQQSLPHRS